MNSLPPPSYSDSYKTRLLSSKMFQKTWYIFLKSSWKIQAYSFSVHAFSMFKNAGSLPESVLMSTGHADVIRPCCLRLLMPVVHADTRGQCLGPCWCADVHGFTVLLQLGVVLMSMTRATTWRLCRHLWPVLLSEIMLMPLGCAATWRYLMSVVCAATGDPCLDLQSLLLHESLLESVAHAATRGHVEVCGTCWHGRTGRYQVSVLLPDTMWSQWSVLMLTVQDKEASSALEMITADLQLRVT